MKHVLRCTILAACVLGMVGCGGDKRTIEAAEAGDVDAQLALGHKYRQGDISDWDEGVKWFRKAAEQGNAEAQYNLGLMIIRGTGARQDGTEAVNWLLKAAEQGNADAQFLLGQVYDGGWAGDNYEPGTEPTPDPVAAKKWYGKAAEQGNSEAQAALDDLK